MKFLFLISLIITVRGYCFIDLGEAAQAAADAAAIVGATDDLIKEVGEEEKEIDELENDIRKMRNEMSNAETFGRKTKRLTQGPNTGVEDTASKISGVRSYIKDLKSYYSKYVSGIVSADAVSAVDNIRKANEEVRKHKETLKGSLRQAKKNAKKERDLQKAKKKDYEFRKKHNKYIRSLIRGKNVSDS